MVTGRHEDVAEARREIECAAEHFTQIRASRRHSQVNTAFLLDFLKFILTKIGNV